MNRHACLGLQCTGLLQCHREIAELLGQLVCLSSLQAWHPLGEEISAPRPAKYVDRDGARPPHTSEDDAT